MDGKAALTAIVAVVFGFRVNFHRIIIEPGSAVPRWPLFRHYLGVFQKSRTLKLVKPNPIILARRVETHTIGGMIVMDNSISARSAWLTQNHGYGYRCAKPISPMNVTKRVAQPRPEDHCH